MKHFANCSPDEFMAQVVKFRTPFSEWCNTIGVKEIRARRPKGYDKMKDKEKTEAVLKAAEENLGDILAAALEKDPEGTKQVICLATFTEPEDFNKHPMTEYLAAIMAMMASQEVRTFFTFFMKPTLKPSSKG